MSTLRPAGAHQAAPETAAAELRRQIQVVAANPAAVRGRRQEADVARQRAKIAGVVGQAFELEGDTPERGAARREPRLGERFHDLAVGGRMPDRRVSSRRLGVVDRPAVRATRKRSFDTPVLVSEADLEKEDLLAMALEAEMPRLDDTGVHRTDADLVDLGAVDAEVVHDRGQAGEAIRRRRAAAVEARRGAHRLGPWVAKRLRADLLRYLAFEELHLWTDRGHRREALAHDFRRPYGELRAAIVGQDQVETYSGPLHRSRSRRRPAVPAPPPARARRRALPAPARAPPHAESSRPT